MMNNSSNTVLVSMSDISGSVDAHEDTSPLTYLVGNNEEPNIVGPTGDDVVEGQDIELKSNNDDNIIRNDLFSEPCLVDEQKRNEMVSSMPTIQRHVTVPQVGNHNEDPIAASTPTLLPSVKDIAKSALTNQKPTEPTREVQSSPSSSYCPLDKTVETISRFNFCVAGQAGTGKTSFCYSTFQQQHFPNFIMKKGKQLDGSPTNEKDLLDSSNGNAIDSIIIKECGRGETTIGSNERTIVTIVDTGGYGNHVNNEKHITAFLKYLEHQNKEYERNGLYRNRDDRSGDTRVHCLFYFFSPHRVEPIDIEFLRHVNRRVPIVPIIAKSDTLTSWELAEQLHKIQSQLNDAGIKCFDFQEDDIDETWLDQQSFDRTTFTRLGRAMMEERGQGPSEDDSDVPLCTGVQGQERPKIRNVFAVVSGNRTYKHGTAQQDDTDLSDTKRLHTVLFRSLGKLRKKTDEIHEEWRTTARLRTICTPFPECRIMTDVVLIALTTIVSLIWIRILMGNVPVLNVSISTTSFAILASGLLVGTMRDTNWMSAVLGFAFLIEAARINLTLMIVVAGLVFAWHRCFELLKHADKK